MGVSTLKRDIWALAPKGLPRKWLASRLGTTESYIAEVVGDGFPDDCKDIRRKDAELFRDLAREGDSFTAEVEIHKFNFDGSKSEHVGTKIEKVTIEKIYPFIVITDRGTYPWGWLMAMIRKAA